MMKVPAKERPARYRQYVESGLAEDDQEFEQAMKASPLAIGSDAFQEEILQFYRQLTREHRKPEDVSFRKIIKPLERREVLEVLAGTLGVGVEAFRQRRRDSALRGVAARMLCRYAGLSHREVAEELHIGSGSAVSRQLTLLNDRLEADRELEKRVTTAERELERRRQGIR
jgi:hypothetical protein